MCTMCMLSAAAGTLHVPHATADSHSIWRRITRALTQFEQAGTEPAAALTAALEAAKAGPGRATLTTLATHLESAARHADGPLLPSWLHIARTITAPHWGSYLDTRTELIRHRVDS